MHQEGVHLRHEDLAGLGLAGAADVDAREEAELHRLLGHGEGAGDHRLADAITVATVASSRTGQ
jgi:hypothetical protein